VVNIIIIEQNNIFRESLKTVLNQIPDFKVVFDGDNIKSFFQNINLYNFQIILLDFNIFQNENTFQIKELLPDKKILILSNYSENSYFDKQANNISKDLIPKSSSKSTLEQKIRQSLQYQFNNYEL